jgi:ubiquitin-conjugating enzyme E2 Q
MCSRYLLVKGAAVETPSYDAPATKHKSKNNNTAPFVKLDPAHPLVLSSKSIEIPEPGYQIETLLEARNFDAYVDDPDAADQAVFEYVEPPQEVIEVDDDSDEDMYDFSAAANPPAPTPVAKAKKSRPANDWKHNPEWVNTHVAHLLPPPVEASSGSTMAVQRELRAMLKEQDDCTSYKDLGWYMPPDLIGDNLFQWIVEMHSFDPDIPIAKDLAAK